MFVLRSTLERVERDRDQADAYALEAHRELERLRAENRRLGVIGRNAEYLQGEVDRLKAELATHQVPAKRGEGGRFVAVPGGGRRERHRGEMLRETSSFADAQAASLARVMDFDRISIRACTLSDGGRGWRVWGYAL